MFELILETSIRVAVGSFFVFSGYHKLFNAGRHKSLVATLVADKIPALKVMEWFVPGVEFLAGLGVAFGFLTPLSALGLLVICLVATCTDGAKRIKEWAPLDKADWLDDLLYLPEVLLILLLVPLVINGAGALSLDFLLLTYMF